MKNILFILLLLFLTSCKNKDVIITTKKNQCACIEKIRESEDMSSNGSGYWIFRQNFPDNCKLNEFSLTSKNFKQLSQTSSVYLLNSSKTKVYSVLIQKDSLSKISYHNYKLEPTNEIILGCDSDFKIKVNFSENNTELKEHFEVSTLKEGKIIYKIHEVKMMSEY